MSKPVVFNQMEFGRWLMACRFEVLLNAGLPNNGPERSLEALDIAQRLESTLSIYLPDSDFSLINNSVVGNPTKVSSSTIELLKIARQLQADTDGAFNIYAAALSDLWGFSKRDGRKPNSCTIEQTVEAIYSQQLEFDVEGQTVTRNHQQVRLNSGGIGKGFALDKMAEHLIGHGVDNFLVHGGQSSMYAKGDRFDLDSQFGWRIAVRHPEQPKVILGGLTLRDIAIGTSGPANQYFYFDGVRYGHIIDPRTGWPASGMMSITVFHPSATKADALATALFVLGVERAEQYCRDHSETSFLAILPTKRQGEVEIVTCNLPANVWSSS